MSLKSMTHRWLIVSGFFVAFAASAVPATAQSAPSGVALSSGGFVENRGQWAPAALFRGSFGPLDVWIQNDGWTLAVQEHSGLEAGPHGSPSGGGPMPVVTTRGAGVRMRFDGSAVARTVGEGRLDSRHNWFVGADPAKWTTDVASYRQVKLSDLYPGVSAVARVEGRSFEYDLVAEPGADVDAVRFACKGQDDLFVNADGELVMRTPHGDLRHSAPVAWEESASGVREPVSCAWQVFGEGRCGFVTGARDTSRRLVIDPGIAWSTLYGGTGDEDSSAGAIAVSTNGNINICGVTTSSTFPTTPGAYQSQLLGPGTWDCFVSRFSPAGVLIWSTFLGGTGYEWARDIAIGPNDTLTIVGSTSSSDFPTVNPFDFTANGLGPNAWGDAFLATFNPAFGGSTQLTWSTYLGGTSDERLNAVVVDPASGIVTAAGWTFSSNIPGITPPNNYQLFQGIEDGIVARFNPALSGTAQLLWFTYFGGSTYDYFTRVAIGPAGEVVVQGATQSTNYPVMSPLQLNNAGGTDSTVTVFNPAQSGASQLLYSTYLGGSGEEVERGLAVEPNGRITVGGWTPSSNFPTTPGAYDTSWNGGSDVFVTRIDRTLAPANQLVYSTFIGGSLDEGINDIVLDPAGGVRAVGSVASVNFPTTAGSFQPTFQGGGAGTSFGPYDGFVLSLDPSGSAVWYASYLGGSLSYDFAYAVARNVTGNLYVTGITRSANFPHSTGTYQNADDVFLLLMEALPTGATRYGFATAGCLGFPEIGVNSMPLNGNAAFAIVCSGAPVSSNGGILAISAAPLLNALFVSGLAVFIDPASPSLILFPASSTSSGLAAVPLPLPAGPGFVGISGYLQFGWPDTCAPGGLSGTSAMLVTIQ